MVKSHFATLMAILATILFSPHSLTGIVRHDFAKQNFSLTFATRGQNRDSLAARQIRELKNGVLLVRLQSKKNTIEVLRNQGRNEQANQLAEEQLRFNRKITDGFQENFDFCPVYFFYSEYSEAVMNRQFEKVVFLNSKMKPDSVISVGKKKFLIAEFGSLGTDTANVKTPKEPLPGEKDSNTSNEGPLGHEGPGMDIPALIVLSDQFVQLKRPFPFYERSYSSLLGKRYLAASIANLNSDLCGFHNLVTGGSVKCKSRK